MKRFWDKVDQSGGLDACWLWTASLNRSGYGQFQAGSSRADSRCVLAHRYAYETVIGPIPEGLDLDHLCGVRACVNPLHLEPVTKAENLRRSSAPNMVARQEGRCRRGHDVTPETTYFRKDRPGHRQCRVCAREADRRRRAAA